MNSLKSEPNERQIFNSLSSETVFTNIEDSNGTIQDNLLIDALEKIKNDDSINKVNFSIGCNMKISKLPKALQKEIKTYPQNINEVNKLKDKVRDAVFKDNVYDLSKEDLDMGEKYISLFEEIPTNKKVFTAIGNKNGACFNLYSRQKG